MVGDGDVLNVERLLQSLQVLDRVVEEQFVLQAITGGLVTRSVVVTGIEEVLEAQVLVYIVPVPEAGNVTVEDRTGVAGPLIQDCWRPLEGVIAA